MNEFDLDIFTEDEVDDVSNDYFKGTSMNKIRDDFNQADNGLEKIMILGDTMSTLAPGIKSFSKDKFYGKGSGMKSLLKRARNSTMMFPIYISRSIRVNEANVVARLFERRYVSLVQIVMSQDPIMDANEFNGLNFLRKYHTNIYESNNELVNEYYIPIDYMDEWMCNALHRRINLPNGYVEFTAIPCNDKYLKQECHRLSCDSLEGFDYLKEDYDNKKKVNVANERTTTTTKSASNQDKINAIINRSTDKGYKDYVTHRVDNRGTLHDSNTVAINLLHRKSHNVDLTDDQLLMFTSDNISRVSVRTQRDVLNAVGDGFTIPNNAFANVNELVNHLKIDDNGVIQIISNGLSPDQQQACTNFKRQYGHIVIDLKKEGDKIKEYQDQFDKDMKSLADLKSTDISTMREKRREGDIINPGPRAPQLLDDKDIKKINDLDPWVVKVTFRLKYEGRMYDDREVLLGVKGLLHPIDYKDLEEDIDDIITGDNKKLRRIRYKTGELSFIEWLFRFDALKKDVAKDLQPSKKWINTQKRLAEFKKKKSNLSGSFFNNLLEDDDGHKINKRDKSVLGSFTGYKDINDDNVGLIPNGTLILSREDVKLIEHSTGIDLEKTRNAEKICDSLFLLTFAIIDKDAGIIECFSPDERKTWVTASLDAVEREISNADKDIKVKELFKSGGFR